MRVLIVKLGSIGDIVHTLPALAALKRAMPNASVSWLVEKKSSEILRDNPLLDDLIEADTKELRRWPVSGETLLTPRQQLRRLRASSFDLALDFQGLFKSALFARLSGAKRVAGFSRKALREPLSRFLLKTRIRVPTSTHVIQKNLSLLASATEIRIPTRADDYEFPIHISDQDELEAIEASRGTDGFYAILNPAGGWPTKLWDAKKFGALADALWQEHGLHSLVTHGPGEAAIAERVTAAAKLGRARTVSLTLKGFCALARGAAIYVGGDTGPTHLAVASRTPVVGLFGPTEWWRNGSPREDDICVDRVDIGCRTNCHRRSCSNWICMDIDPEHVIEAVAERLRRANRASVDMEAFTVA